VDQISQNLRMLYLIHTMKKLVRPALVLGICLSLALLNAELTYSFQPAIQESLTATVSPLQLTTTPQPQDVSEIGSTDGIIAMVGIIVLIVIVPIFLRRKDWM
jgi:hypothetical protein